MDNSYASYLPVSEIRFGRQRTQKYLCNIIMTSSNGNISVLLALCAGHSPFAFGFPSQGPVMQSVVRGIHRSLSDSPHKGQWWRALIFSLISASWNWSIEWRQTAFHQERTITNGTKRHNPIEWVRKSWSPDMKLRPIASKTKQKQLFNRCFWDLSLADHHCLFMTWLSQRLNR